MNMLQMSEAMRNGQPIPINKQIKLIISLSIPAILEQLVLTMMNYIDTAMVGSLGANATAAIGVVASSTWLINGIINAIAVGFSVQIAQYLGAGREKDSRNVLCQAILFNIVFGIIMATIIVSVSRFLPEFLGAEPAIRSDATAYLGTLGLFYPLSMSAILYASIFRCSGNVVLPSLMNIAMCLLDVVFNFFFIYPTREIGGITILGAGLGVKGAALGTGLAQACVGILLFLLVIRLKGPMKLQGDESWRFTKLCMNNAFHLATPTALERVTLSVAQIVISTVVNSMGSLSVAANYLAVQTEGICYLPAYGIAAAATALVGQSIGAKRPDMAKRFAYGTTALGFVLVTITGGLLFFFAPQLTGLLTPDTQVIRMSTQVLRIVAFSEPLFAISIVATGALRGAGDSKGPFYLNLFSMWGVRVLTILFFTRKFGVIGIWGTMTAELCFRGIVFLIRLVKGNWLQVGALE